MTISIHLIDGTASAVVSIPPNVPNVTVMTCVPSPQKFVGYFGAVFTSTVAFFETEC